MSFDIEASSSHGDFPVPIKTYKKLATNIIEYFEGLTVELTKDSCKDILRKIILSAFGFEKMTQIDLVYPIKKVKTQERVVELCEKWLNTLVSNMRPTDDLLNVTTIEKMFEKMGMDEEDDGDHPNYVKAYDNKKATIVDVLCDKKFDRDGKLNELNQTLNQVFPKLEGDKVTFIGSTFMNYGNKDPNFNHCIALNTCSTKSFPENTVIESYTTEKEVLLAWQKLVQRENPDIVIGYNIFGFDYQFMFNRAEENKCTEEFLKLSRNKDEVCGIKDKDTGKYKLEESVLQIASGQHELAIYKDERASSGGPV